MAEKLCIAFVARLHLVPKESTLEMRLLQAMAEWFTEGLLKRLVDKHDSLALHCLRVSSLARGVTGAAD